MLETRPAGRVAARREAMRAEVVAAAWQVCREEGLAALSLREVAARLGMRAPSLYSYVESKDAIYDAMFAQGQRELAEVMAFLPDEGVGREELRAGTHAFVDFCLADPTRYQLLFQRTIPGFTPSEESYALAVATLGRMTRQFLSAGIAEQRHLDLWTAVVSGLVAQQLSNEPGGNRWARLVDEAVDLFCDHVGVPPTTPREHP